MGLKVSLTLWFQNSFLGRLLELTKRLFFFFFVVVVCVSFKAISSMGSISHMVI